MKAINIKKELYLLLTLFFCISLQGVELDQIRRPHPHHARPNQKPNSTESQNMPNWNAIPESQNRAGSFDPDFAPDGKGYTIDPMGHNSAPREVTTQPNNKVVVAGVRDDYPFLARYNDNGVNRDGTISVLDKNFGIGNYGPGVTIQTSLGKGSFFNAVAIQEHPDLRIIGAGKANGTCMLACYNPNGTLNTLFGAYGIVTTNIDGELNAIAIQKDSKVVVAGTHTYRTLPNVLLMRYDEDGLLDDDFGTQGVVLTYVGPTSRGNGITIQEHDNKIVVVGVTANTLNNQYNMIIARYDENGTLDFGFGSDHYNPGTITLQVGKNNSIAYDVKVQKDGKIIIVGTSISQNDKSQFTIIRLNPNGSPDTFFGTNGDGVVSVVPTHNPDHNAYARSVALDENENIIVMGYAITPAPDNYNYFSLVRFDQNGILDTTFGNQGVRNQSLGYGINNLPNKIGIPAVGSMQHDKKKLVLVDMYSNNALNTSNLMAVARYLN